MDDIINRINQLKEKRKWSLYKLAEESKLSQSTLSNIFLKKNSPSISTLKKLCDAFEISLGEFFQDKTDTTLSMEEAILLNDFQKLSPRNKEAVKNLIVNLQ